VTDDLAAYLLARYDEIEQVAQAAVGKDAPTWRADDQGEVFAVRDLQDPRCEHHTAGVPNHCDDLPVASGVASGADVTDDADLEQARAAHIAMHDPAAVLRDIAAKRAIVKECHETFVAVEGWEYAAAPDLALRTLLLLAAQPFADRDDFRDQWRL
jgi:hypothetical protein